MKAVIVTGGKQYTVSEGDVLYIEKLNAEAEENVKFDPSDILVPRINNNSRVYKGGSWNDRIYWLNPTTRRFMDQSESSSTVGFRCAMSMLGQN